MKDVLLSVVSPKCIHRETYMQYGKPDEHRYYLFYEVGDRLFHSPIGEWRAREEEADGFQVVDIDNLATTGHDIDDLLSAQFVRKVVELVESGDYSYVPEG